MQRVLIASENAFREMMGLFVTTSFVCLFLLSSPSLAGALPSNNCDSLLTPIPTDIRLSIDRNNLPVAIQRLRDITPEELSSVKALEILPQVDLNNQHMLRDLTIQAGFAMGFPKIESEQIISLFLKSGAVGGALHTVALLDGIGIEYNKTKKPSDVASAPAPRKVLRKLFDQILTEKNPSERATMLNVKATAMAEAVTAISVSKGAFENAIHRVLGSKVDLSEIVAAEVLNDLKELNSRLRDPRVKALLATWFRGTLEQSINTTQKRGAGSVLGFLAKAPRVANFATLPTMYTSLFSMAASVILPGISGTTDLFLISAPLSLVTVIYTFSGTAGRMDDRCARFCNAIRKRQLRKVLEPDHSIQRLLTDATTSNVVNLTAGELVRFDLNESFEPLSIPLRAAVSQESLRVEFMIERELPVMVEDLIDGTAPILRLSWDTLELQEKRLKQINESILDLESLLSRASLDSKEANLKKLETAVLRYRHHLRGLEIDNSYVVNAVSEQRALLARALEIATEANDQLLKRQAEILRDEVENRLSDMQKRFNREMAEAKEGLFAINRLLAK